MIKWLAKLLKKETKMSDEKPKVPPGTPQKGGPSPESMNDALQFLDWCNATFNTVPKTKEAYAMYNQMMINAMALKFDEVFKSGFVCGKLEGKLEASGQTKEDLLKSFKIVLQQEGILPKDGAPTDSFNNNVPVPKKDDLN